MKDLQGFYKKQLVLNASMSVILFVLTNVLAIKLFNIDISRELSALVVVLCMALMSVFILGSLLNAFAYHLSINNYNMFTPSYHMVTPCSTEDKKYTYVFESKYYYYIGYFEKTYNLFKLLTMLNSEVSIIEIDKYSDDGVKVTELLFQEEPIFSVYDFPDGRWDH